MVHVLKSGGLLRQVYCICLFVLQEEVVVSYDRFYCICLFYKMKWWSPKTGFTRRSGGLLRQVLLYLFVLQDEVVVL